MSKEKDDSFSKVIEDSIVIQMKYNIKANEKLGVTQQYNKDTRKLFDNENAKKAFKNEAFNGKKTMIDPITGELLHFEQSNAKSKYKIQSGSKKWAKHAPETDHIVSLKGAHNKLKYNPFLSDEDVNKILNDRRYNYRVTSKRFNTQKQDKSDISMALKFKNEIPTKGRIRLITQHGKANVGITLHATALTTKNVAKEFEQGTKVSLEASVIPILFESVHNLYLFTNGEKELKEGAKDIGKLTKNIAVSGGIRQIVTTGVNGNVTLQKLANSNQIAQIISVSLIIKDSLIHYINGDIDGEEFFREIAEKGVGMVSGTIGAIVGQTLIPIPVVGGIIGSIIVSTVCSGLYITYSSINENNEKLERVNSIASQALCEMKRQRDILKVIIEEQFGKWDEQFNLGFEEMFAATMNDNVEGISIGLDRILNVFDETVKFKTFEEFDEFFMDENATLTL